MYIGKLFNKYDVNFPVENELSIIIGENGTGKTQVLNLLNEYFINQGKNSIFFKENRILKWTLEDAKSIYLMLTLSLNENLFDKYNINLDLMEHDFKYYYGNTIRSGFLQITNFICTILKAPEKSIVLIDFPETNLSIWFKRNIIDDLLKLKNIEKLIVVTHSPEVLQNHTFNVVTIEKCVELM